MPYDAELTGRMRLALKAHVGISEMQMMGGNCFFLNGNMLSGARRDKNGIGRFMFRVGKALEAEALQIPGAEPVIHGKRRLGGFISVQDAACDEAALNRWLAMCLEHASALPAKN
ncbi:TfoX/Sxy family protein [uncultured Roseobacter sp.]|uniref:TfoX/Sxy family protein n=1 Tax=uncultured Roseobacter sp. TaxID=114847 RepID=UPI0026033209|nr:TfoX/Sxy family protein [uncultured Roseobacter sp.]